MCFKKHWMSLVVNQTKYEKISAARFTIDQSSHSYMETPLKHIQQTTDENPLLLRNLSGP